MKTASLKQLKSELEFQNSERVVELIIRLVRYKKENKELLTYLLFESNNEVHYINEVKILIDADFDKLNSMSFYLAKKTIRKALRTTNKFIKYSGNKQTEVELLIYFAQKLRDSDLEIEQSKVIANMYYRQLEKINKSLKLLHEDLQYDFKEDIEGLTI
ncbi:MAG: hypothetical protein KAG84_08305 [Bacteroidales bacterium]|nr:hypothetical protein [Bacteroidales bacterium]